MPVRPAVRIVLMLGVTLVLAVLVMTLVQAPQATDAGMLLTYQVLGALAGFASIAVVLWAVFVVIGSIRWRDRARSRRMLWFIASAVLCGSINAVVVSALSAGADGWGGLIAAIAVGVAGIFTVSAITATLIVELVILRPRAVPAGTNAPSAGP